MPDLCRECTQPCNCNVQDDGIVLLNGSYIITKDKGRRNTVVDGTGTDNNPHTVSFIDSEFYRPPASERNLPNQSVSTPANFVQMSTGDQSLVIYQTPTVVSIASSPESISLVGPFIFVGFTVTFPDFSAVDTESIKIMINFVDVPFDFQTMAASSTDTFPGEELTLTTVGFVPGHLIAGVGGPVGFDGFQFLVEITESVGSVQLSNIRMWAATL